jgi:hypothetical protein
MSVDVSRSYIISTERLRDAFEAAAEIAPRSREPREYRIALPDGSAIVFPFAPFGEQPPYVLRTDPQDFLSFDYAVRVACGDDVDAYLRRNPEPPFRVKRLKSGGMRAIVYTRLLVSADPRYAVFSFSNTSNEDCDVLDLPSVCDVLDYVGRCADSLVTYRTVMGEDQLVEPIQGDLPKLAHGDDEGDLSLIVEYVQSKIREIT